MHNPKTVADGARTPSLGALTFPLVLEHVADVVTVDDATLLRAMFYLWERLSSSSNRPARWARRRRSRARRQFAARASA